MPIVVAVFIALLLVVILILQCLVLRRKVGVDLSPLQQSFSGVEKAHERTERIVREEIGKNREEGVSSARQSREELSRTLDGISGALNRQLAALAQSNDQSLEKMRETMERRLQSMQEEGGKKLEQVRLDAQAAAKGLREEVNLSLKGFGELLMNTQGEIGRVQRSQLGNIVDQLGKLTESNEKKLESLRTTVAEQLQNIQQDSARQLEQMRQTVDEKLQGTLEKRLGESFKQVGDQLEAVYKGLGEMRVLATGVGDLKKVLTNVKTRGTWGEVQLGAMLEQVLTPDQYAINVATKDGGERVEFAIRFPGRSDDADDVVWLPIDAKFPMEDYQRLIEAQDNADADSAEAAARQLDIRVKACARDICDKYLNPPKTTDFAILFLPIEGLFAQVVRRTAVTEVIQRECRVIIAGPTTLWSILNSLQMGFRTLAIQKHSSEVWNLLAAVKTEWSKYGDVLSRVQKKLQEATNTIDDVATRNRAIGRKLNKVHVLPTKEADAVLMLDGINGDGAAEEA